VVIGSLYQIFLEMRMTVPNVRAPSTVVKFLRGASWVYTREERSVPLPTLQIAINKSTKQRGGRNVDEGNIELLRA